MAFAIKIQACTGVDGQDAAVNPDFRGGEPADHHATLAELDPVDDSELENDIELAKVLNRFLKRLNTRGLHLEIRIMDSDGRV